MGWPAVVMLWLIVAAISLGVFRHGMRMKSWLLRIIGGVPLAFIMVLVLGMTLRFILSNHPGYVFRQAFGELPENSIKVIEHSYRFSTDYVSIYLKLEASRDDFEKMLEVGFQESDGSRLDQASPYSSAPSWFMPLKQEATEFYRQTPFGDEGHTLSEACLSYNETDRIAYFYGHWVD